MREGINPNKNSLLEKNQFFHQVIIPVYIPNEEGYFKDSFTIFQYSLTSLFKTIHSETYISIINNGSSDKVKDYLESLLETKLINELVHTENIGKVNAVLKGLVGHSFPIVTISDADVMFLNDWQEKTYEVFESFPKAGVVGLTPMLNLSYYLTSNLIFENFFSNKIKFSKILNYEGMLNFYKSIGREKEFIATNDKRSLVIKSMDCTACIGSGHYVATYKGEVFDYVKKFSNYKLGGDIEFQIDELAFKKGFWRLNTHDNFAFHLGNAKEDWMEKEIEKLTNSVAISNLNISKVREYNKLEYYIYNKIFYKILYNKAFRRFFENRKRE